MAAVTTGVHDSTGEGGAPVPIRLRPVAARRRPVVAAVSVVVVLVSAAVVGGAFAAAGRTTPVLVVTRQVAVGSPIEAGDVDVVPVHVPTGVATVAAAAEATVLGRSAAQRLLPGTLLTAADLAEGSGIPPGDALVGVAVTDAQLPVGGLRAGVHVDIVETASPGSPASVAPTGPDAVAGSGSSPPSDAVIVSDAPVDAVQAASPSGASPTTAVTIVVPVADAPQVAQLSAAGQAAIVAVSAGS